MFVFVTIPYLI